MHDGDGVLDLLSLFCGEFVETGIDAGDQAAGASDFFVRGHRFGACPVVEFCGGEQAFAGAQQVVQVGVQVGKVGHVGAEVVAAGAAEPKRAGAAAGFDVGRFGADPERDGDLADGAASMLGVQ